ncbi:UDP-N-acetylmuramate--alanine ligase [bacterium]|nr:UDP-N-acetylmuramate--alanine ligase [candidate division CSSED10-310 bacterium]
MKHFVGIAGSGMRNLAMIARARGEVVSGSDRSFDQGNLTGVRDRLAAAGVAIHRQDGSGVTNEVTELVVSTAVEAAIPDMVRARRLNIPITHRADYMAQLVNAGRGIAVAGTSGKTTITGMIVHILHHCAWSPSFLLGGELLTEDGAESPGHGLGRSDWWCYETDESDGSIAKFTPEAGVLSNISKDHHDMSHLQELFAGFLHACASFIVIPAPCPLPTDLLPRRRTITFSISVDADCTARDIIPLEWGSRFTIDGVSFQLRVPGKHNVANALAATAVTRELGIDLRLISAALHEFHGIKRRMNRVGVHNGITVIDDFAHNPDKMTASIHAARHLGDRILAVFQPHGFGPLRFMRRELGETIAACLEDEDEFLLLPVFYAGGTVTRDIGSEDLAADIRAMGRRSSSFSDRDRLRAYLKSVTRPGDTILIMGARDDTLSMFARGILNDCIEQPES